MGAGAGVGCVSAGSAGLGVQVVEWGGVRNLNVGMVAVATQAGRGLHAPSCHQLKPSVSHRIAYTVLSLSTPLSPAKLLSLLSFHGQSAAQPRHPLLSQLYHV